jgi:hypothetical protein
MLKYLCYNRSDLSQVITHGTIVQGSCHRVFCSFKRKLDLVISDSWIFYGLMDAVDSADSCVSFDPRDVSLLEQRSGLTWACLAGGWCNPPGRGGELYVFYQRAGRPRATKQQCCLLVHKVQYRLNRYCILIPTPRRNHREMNNRVQWQDLALFGRWLRDSLVGVEAGNV